MKETSWQERFDEFYTLPSNMIPGPQREKAIKAFIIEVEAAAEERCFEKGRKQYTGFAHTDGWNAALATVKEKVRAIYEGKYSHFTREYTPVDAFRDDISKAFNELKKPLTDQGVEVIK